MKKKIVFFKLSIFFLPSAKRRRKITFTIPDLIIFIWSKKWKVTIIFTKHFMYLYFIYMYNKAIHFYTLYKHKVLFHEIVLQEE